MRRAGGGSPLQLLEQVEAIHNIEESPSFVRVSNGRQRRLNLTLYLRVNAGCIVHGPPASCQCIPPVLFFGCALEQLSAGAGHVSPVQTSRGLDMRCGPEMGFCRLPVIFRRIGQDLAQLEMEVRGDRRQVKRLLQNGLALAILKHSVGHARAAHATPGYLPRGIHSPAQQQSFA
jgi:hypothetical protein